MVISDLAVSDERKVLPSVVIGAIAGIDNITTALAIGALIFSGTLASGMGLGVGVVLIGGALLALLVALRSTVPNSVALVQENTIAILSAAILAMVVQSQAASGTNVATAIAIIGLSSLTTGLAFWLAGHFKLGALVRFVPYPVVAGFLAGSGWLLVDGAVSVVTGHSIGQNLFAAMGDEQTFMRMVPTIAFAAIMFVGLLRFDHMATMPAIMVLAAALFYAVLAFNGVTVDEARVLGQLPALNESGSIDLPSLGLLSQVDWRSVLTAAPAMAVIAGLSMVGFMLNVSGLELALGRDIDVNAELRSTGIANMASGAVGGPSGYMGLSMTVLAQKTGATGRGAGIATAIVMLVGALLAGNLVFLVPVFLTGGFLLYLGFDLIHEWLIKTRQRMPLSEWLIVVVILLTVAVVGFTEGLAVGLLVSCAVFVFKYSRLPVVRFSATGAELRSNVDRSPSHRQQLAEHGDAIEVVQLQGYLFFGTADRVVELVRRRLADTAKPTLKFIILDFENVSGADSAAVSCFVKIRKLIEQDQVVVYFTHLENELRQHLMLAGIAFEQDALMRLDGDLDHALEKAEEFIIHRQSGDDDNKDLAAIFASLIGPHERLDDLVAEMEALKMTTDDTLIRQGDQSRDVYFIQSGQVSVRVTLPNGKLMRVRTMLAGAVVGEIALYTKQSRSADVIVDMPSEIYALSAQKLAHLEKADAELASLVHRILASTLSEKLTVATRVMQLRQS